MHDDLPELDQRLHALILAGSGNGKAYMAPSGPNGKKVKFDHSIR